MLGFKLPKKIEWSIENHQRNGNVLVETFLRFKGLESQIIYLWCLENYNHSESITGYTTVLNKFLNIHPLTNRSIGRVHMK